MHKIKRQIAFSLFLLSFALAGTKPIASITIVKTYLALIENQQNIQIVDEDVNPQRYSNLLELNGVISNSSAYSVKIIEVNQKCKIQNTGDWVTNISTTHVAPSVIFPDQFGAFSYGVKDPFFSNICYPLVISAYQNDLVYMTVTDTQPIYPLNTKIISVETTEISPYPDLYKAYMVTTYFSLKNESQLPLYNVTYWIMNPIEEGMSKVSRLADSSQVAWSPNETRTFHFSFNSTYYPNSNSYYRATHNTHIVAQGSSDPDIWPY